MSWVYVNIFTVCTPDIPTTGLQDTDLAVGLRECIYGISFTRKGKTTMPLKSTEDSETWFSS